MKTFRQMLEEKLQKKIVGVFAVGKRGGRNVYEVDFADGTQKDYYIDFNDFDVEEV